MIEKAIEKLLAYTGNPSQVFYTQRMRLCEGKADGLEMIEVVSGPMLLWIMPGRSMDIGRLSYAGKNLSFLSKAGYSNAAYYDAAGMAGLNTFTPGFLTTCGLRNSGMPNRCEGEDFGFHGRIGQTPAEEVCVSRELGRETPVITLKGKTHEGWLFGSSLTLSREIKVYYELPFIDITDVIFNNGTKDEPCMILYHFNFGYPLLDENARFITSYKYEKPVDENAKIVEDERSEFRMPERNVPERCYYYKQREGSEEAFAACLNERLGIGVAIRTRPEELPLLCQWKSWAAGDYVMGIEPCNCHGDGRAKHMERGELEIIPAYSKKTVHIRVEILSKDGVERMVHADKQNQIPASPDKLIK